MLTRGIGFHFAEAMGHRGRLVDRTIRKSAEQTPNRRLNAGSAQSRLMVEIVVNIVDR